MLQTMMIERVRHLCQQDERLVAALMYGSFTRGEGDQFSDIEFALFFADEQLPKLDQQAWVAQIAPLALYFADDVGHQTAIFTNLIRGEFHFKPASELPVVETWRGNAWFPSLAATVLVDRTGELAKYLQPLLGASPERDTAATVLALTNNFINWMLFGSNVLARGERARALEILGIIHRYLLWMVRVLEGATAHWPTPSKNVEQDISAAAYARYQQCTATLDQVMLAQAYRMSWTWGQTMIEILAQRHQLALPALLLRQLTERLTNRPPTPPNR